MNNSIGPVTDPLYVANGSVEVYYNNGETQYKHGVGLHLNDVYACLVRSALIMEERVRISLENYTEHPDLQANLQQLQYDLQSWNLALTTMTNMQKNMADALKSIVGNLR